MELQKKVIGVRHIKGEFNGNPYDNYLIYVAWEGNEEDLTGLCPSDTIKVKASGLQDFLLSVNVNKITDLIGEYVSQVFYNQYRQAVSLILYYE